jgi:RNA polymerase primary sigma factor
LVTDNGELLQQEKLEIEQGLEHLEILLNELPERERWCLELRYGIDADGLGPLTYQAIGELLDVSRERVRQIEAKCLKKMRQKLNPIRRVRDP